MADRRMFAKSIVLSDAFLDMPMSARCLYFTLGMLADDDGFIGSPKAIMRQCGASQDDMATLLQKRYVLLFESGVIVIKHWRMNNYLRNDRYKLTSYVEELETLTIDEKGAYTERGDGAPIALPAKNTRKPLTTAEARRYEAKKNSSLPNSFEYKIRDAFSGCYCPRCHCLMEKGDRLRKPTIQHNVPISLGGKHELNNISVICAKCNASIGNHFETPPYNTEEVKQMWAVIGDGSGFEDERCENGSGMETQNSIGKVSKGKCRLEESSNDTVYKEEHSTSTDTFSSCAEQLENSSALTLPLNDGTEYPVLQSTVDEYAKLYPAVDVMQELRNMRGWLIANPTKRKTKRGINAFINNWLCKEQDKRGGAKVGAGINTNTNVYSKVGRVL